MPANKTSILIVEDNPIAAQAALRIFEMLGCQVEATDDGEKAVQLVKKNHYNGICMDIGLPTLSGSETCKAIREYEAINHLIPIPIIAVTANNSPDEKQEYLNAGMQEAIDKPLTKAKAEHFLTFCK
ncbi:MAG: response regulator [Tatlockia sp.]|nr:response regulator [Tatlockia sp.]